MKLIETKTLETAQASIEFTSIPQDFTDLVIRYSVRGDNANFQGLQIYFNGANSNLTSRYLLGTGSSAASGTLSYGFAGSISGTGSTSNTFGNGTLYITNYTGSTNKSFSVDNVTENNATTSYQDIVAGLWSQTAAINSITFFGRADGGGTNNLIAGSTISLYGIGGAGDANSPKATGGIIQKIGDYWVHTFTASGTFTPIENLADVEYLVIAGGGSGAAAASGNAGGGGGGGAGGYRSSVTGESSGAGSSAESMLSLISGTSYTITVGAGGANVPVGNTNGNNGTNSVFGAITSTGGGGGGRKSTTGLSGGSGGGGGTPSSAGGSPQSNQGFSGGTATGSLVPGGGGGAGEAGGTGGGAGVSSTITGTPTLRAGGGGAAGGAGVLAGGGTNGFQAGSSGATAGAANTGSGGGGGIDNTGIGTNGGAGGSGIVIVRYAA